MARIFSGRARRAGNAVRAGVSSHILTIRRTQLPLDLRKLRRAQALALHLRDGESVQIELSGLGAGRG